MPYKILFPLLALFASAMCYGCSSDSGHNEINTKITPPATAAKTIKITDKKALPQINLEIKESTLVEISHSAQAQKLYAEQPQRLDKNQKSGDDDSSISVTPGLLIKDDFNRVNDMVDGAKLDLKVPLD